MTYDVEHLSYLYLHVCIFCSEVSVCIFAQFSAWLFVFLLLSYLYILDTSPLLDMCFANIFT